jgi:hypothetical protein
MHKKATHKHRAAWLKIALRLPCVCVLTVALPVHAHRSLSRVYLCLSHIHTLTLTHSHAPPVLLWAHTTYLIVQAAADGVCARHRWYSVSSAPIPTIVSTHAALYMRHTYVVTQVHTIARLTLALCKQVSKCAYIRLHACVCMCVCMSVVGTRTCAYQPQRRSLIPRCAAAP